MMAQSPFTNVAGVINWSSDLLSLSLEHMKRVKQGIKLRRNLDLPAARPL
jgi:hypothetical protein